MSPEVVKTVSHKRCIVNNLHALLVGAHHCHRHVTTWNKWQIFWQISLESFIRLLCSFCLHLKCSFIHSNTMNCC